MRAQSKSTWFLGLIGVVLAMIVCCPLQAQSGNGEISLVPPAMSAPTKEVTRSRTDVDLVLVNVSVLDSAQKVLTGLYFSTEDVPISMTVVLDASGSMETKLPKALDAARRLFELSLA